MPLAIPYRNPVRDRSSGTGRNGNPPMFGELCDETPVQIAITAGDTNGSDHDPKER
jgi:hypothetical protein